MITRNDLLKDYYMVDLCEVKSRLKKGQKVWLKDDLSALCVKLHPQILTYIGEVGELKNDGKKYTANWTEIMFKDKNGDRKEITVCDAYLEVLLQF